MRLQGRAAIVTGAAHGIGRAICVELAREGASVWACDVLARELEETRRTVEAVAAGACRVAELDVRDPEAVTALVARIEATAGRIDDDWQVIFAINLNGAFHFTRAAAPIMKRAGRGAIVNISSGAGRSYSLTGIQAYASAKAGLIGFTRQTARELGAHGIRVNCVAPGFVRSNPASERQWEAMGAAGQRRLLDSIALGRLGRPEEIARAVIFFLSDDAAYVTGQTISVDGGHWMLG